MVHLEGQIGEVASVDHDQEKWWLISMCTVVQHQPKSHLINLEKFNCKTV